MKKEKVRKSADKRLETLAPTPTKAVAPPQIWNVAHWHYVAALAFSIFITMLVYGPALRGEFVFDDAYLPFMDSSVAEAPLRAWLGVRPVLMLTYWLNYQSAGLNPYPYHLVGMLLHAVNAILVWTIVRKYLSFVSTDRSLNQMLGIFSGLLFLLHPVQTESVAYVASRSETLSVFFFLSAVAVYIYRTTEAVNWVRAVGVLLLFGIAVSVKEHTVVLPVFLALTDLYFTTPFQLDGLKRNWRMYVLIVAAGAVGVVAVLKLLAGADSAGFRVSAFTWYQYLFSQFRSIWLYLRLYILPVDLNGDYDLSASRTLFDQGAIFGLIGLLLLAFAAIRYRRRYPLASFGFLAFLVLLAPTSSFVPIRDLAAERRLYLPFIGLLLITAELLRHWRIPRATMGGAMVAVLAVCAFFSHQRSQIWASNLVFWQDTVQKSPHNSRAWFQLAFAKWQNGQCQEANTAYEQVAKLGGQDDRLLIDWAFSLECAGRVEEAIAKLREATRATQKARKPGQRDPVGHVYASLGMIYGKHGRSSEALQALDTAEKLDPSFDMTYVYRGNVMLNSGDLQGAVAQYRKAISINPANQAARDALASATRQLQSPAR